MENNNSYNREEAWIFQQFGKPHIQTLRIYIKPKLESVFNGWNKLLEQLEVNEEVKKVGFFQKLPILIRMI